MVTSYCYSMLKPVAGRAFWHGFRESRIARNILGNIFWLYLSNDALGYILGSKMFTTLLGVEDLKFDSEAPITRPVSYTICFRVGNII